MPVIKFLTDWLKVGENVKQGDNIRFEDKGTQNEDGGWIFNVGIIPEGEKDAAEIKKFQLNKTNFEAIKAVYGENSDKWLKKEMTVHVVKRQNPKTGQIVDGIALAAPGTPGADGTIDIDRD